MQNANYKEYEFLVKVNNKPLLEYESNGDTYVEGRKGSEYELYFKNHTYNRVLVVFSVDGLSIMDGKTASKDSRGYIVEGYKDLTVPGWTINSNKVAKFQFQPQNDKSNTTYVELLQEEGFNVDPSNQGVIGCMVFKERYVPPQVEKLYFYPQVYHDYLNPPLEPNWNDYDNQGLINGGWREQYGSISGGLSSSSMGCMSSSNYTGTTTRYVGDNLVGVGMKGMSMNYASPDISAYSVETGLGTQFGDDKRFDTTSSTFNREYTPAWVAVINYDTLQGLRKRGIFVKENNHAKAFPDYKEVGCHIPKRR